MEKNVIILAGLHLDLDKISGILKNDSKVFHHGKTSTSVHFFTVLIDGQKVDVEARSQEERDVLKQTLITRLGWGEK